MAWNIDIPAGYGQGQFKDLTRDGFDVSAQTSFIDIDDNSSYWSAVTDDAPGYITYPSVRVRKGLPFGIDIGAMYTYIADTDIQVYGAELSKAILEGSAATPALGVRATYSRLSGIDDMSLQTAGVDASISKGILIFTPYAGVGMLWIDGKYDGNTLGVSLDQESFWQSRGFVGLKITPIPLVSVTAEAEYAARPIYSLKVGVNF